ncbi:MAG: M13 family peptidase [Oscillospiraceae bacterium]|nr:M13 family peptidase [Oscillospiraceae bacterium]
MKLSLCSRIVTLFLAALLLACAVLPLPVLASVRLQDDFYAAVNADWLARTMLADDRPSVSGFCELAQAVHQRLRADFDAMDEADGALGQFLAYYAMASDYAARDALGAAPLMPYIRRIQSLETLAQLNDELNQWVLDGLALPFSLHVGTDMGDANRHALYATAPVLFLPEVSYYSDSAGLVLLEVLAETGRGLLELADVPNVCEVVADAIAFDAMLVPYAKTAEELGAYAAMYNPMPMEAFAQMGGELDFAGLVMRLLGTLPDEVLVPDAPYFAAFAELVTEENLPMLRHWMLFHTVFNLSGYLDRTFQSTAQTYRMALTGQALPREPSELAFLLAAGVYGGVVGDYYGRTYFGEEARAEVEAMAERLIETFQCRLTRNDWLSPTTIAAAIEKLDALTINIGYPDAIDPIYERFVVTNALDGGTLLGNTMAFARIVREANFACYGEPVNRDAWSITAHTVNAQYNPLAGAITFPAAILQAPFYSSAQSESANYGGIGAVIAHEITHAFDTNGAQFGADGSLYNWWTDADYAAFAAKAEAMVALFDGTGSVCGRMTVSENIADAGGLASALEVVQSLADGDLEAFFRNWAVIWRMKSTPEYAALLLALDVHAPNQLRANVQLGNLDAFYEVFEVSAGDGMYIPPEQRVAIW